MIPLIFGLSILLIVVFFSMFVFSFTPLFAGSNQKRNKIGIFLISLLIFTVVSITAIIKTVTIPESSLKSGYIETVKKEDFHAPSSNEYRCYAVSSFKPSYYEIGKPNFSSGNCYGIVKVIRDAYYKSQPQKMKITLNKAGEDPNDRYLYPKPDPYFFKNPGQNNQKNYTWDDITSISNNILISRITNKDLVQSIIKAQKDQNFSGAALFNWPSNEKANLVSFIFINTLSWRTFIGQEIDTKWIIEQVRSNKPVIIGIGNKIVSGHALLCYKVELFGNNRYKFYVLDSNVVYSEPKSDFEKSTYVLVWEEKGKQHFLYNPNINGVYPYHGIYNSFTPGAWASWN